MVTSKIIQILRKLNKNELSKFRDFLASPYFNNKRKMVLFYDKLKKYAPGFDDTKIDRNEIYKHLYPGSRFNAQVYKNLCSELYSLVREFIAVSSFTANEYEAGIRLLEKLESSGADELFESELKNLKKKLNAGRYNDIKFFYRFRIALTERNFLYHRSKRSILNTSGYEESNELMKYYFVHAFRQRFDFESLALNFNIAENENPAISHIGKQLETGMVQSSIDEMKAVKSKDYEVVAIFYYILMSFKHPGNDLYFNYAKELVFKNINKFDRSAQFEVTDALYGLFSFRMMHNASIENYRDTFDIINFRLKRKIYKEDPESYLDAISFRAIFLTGLRLREYEWLKRFLKKYIKDVNPEYRENLNNLLTSFNKFYEKKYEESLKSLNKVKYDINLYKLDVRKLQLLNYYELDYVESAFSLIASFKEFLKSNRDLTGAEQAQNLKLVSTFSKLLKLKSEYNEFRIIKLENAVKKDAEVLYRYWFLEKIQELKTQNNK